VDTSRAIDKSIRKLQRTGIAGAAADHDRQQFVVSETVYAEALQLFTWAIVWCHVFHQRYTQFSMFRRSSSALSCIVTACLCVACAAPPNKEMDQAQGAIDAARAAGADRYATTEYSAAVDALKNANDAVAVGDYRLALNFALESREQAQNAARGAADTKARVRADVERGITQITAVIAQARTRLAAAERARVPRRLLLEPRADLMAAEAALQKAGEAVGEEDYLGAREALEGINDRVDNALTAINAAIAPRAPARRR
jgi:hypothetical protein